MVRVPRLLYTALSWWKKVENRFKSDFETHSLSVNMYELEMLRLLLLLHWKMNKLKYGGRNIDAIEYNVFWI